MEELNSVFWVFLYYTFIVATPVLTAYLGAEYFCVCSDGIGELLQYWYVAFGYE